MKASIITMTSTYNYGATFQAYALQTYVESLGHSCEMVNLIRVCESEHRRIKLNDFSRGNLAKLLYKSELETGYRNFELFYKQHMHMTRRYADEEDLKKNPPDSDVYITGSDQVWNPRNLKGAFYLDYAPAGKKKISYAASIGDTCIPESVAPRVREYLSTFDGISVREQEAKTIISNLTEKTVTVNCDPIFLLDREQWRELEQPVKGIKKKYVLCYFIYQPKWLNEWLDSVRKMTGCEIVFVGLNGFHHGVFDKYIRNAGPREFLWLIDHSEAVATSSFHGTAFSVMFGKPLKALVEPNRPDRIHNLLRKFGLNSCEVYENHFDDSFEKYTNSEVDKVLAADRKNSREYLMSMFST